MLWHRGNGNRLTALPRIDCLSFFLLVVTIVITSFCARIFISLLTLKLYIRMWCIYWKNENAKKLISFGVFRNINKLPWKANSAIIYSCFFFLLILLKGSEWEKMAIGKMIWLSPYLKGKYSKGMLQDDVHSFRFIETSQYLECRSCLQL